MNDGLGIPGTEGSWNKASWIKKESSAKQKRGFLVDEVGAEIRNRWMSRSHPGCGSVRVGAALLMQRCDTIREPWIRSGNQDVRGPV